MRDLQCVRFFMFATSRQQKIWSHVFGLFCLHIIKLKFSFFLLLLSSTFVDQHHRRHRLSISLSLSWRWCWRPTKNEGKIKTLNTFVCFIYENRRRHKLSYMNWRGETIIIIKQQTKWTTNTFGRRKKKKKRQTCTHRKWQERKLWNVRHHLSIQIACLFSTKHFFFSFNFRYAIATALGQADREFYLFRNEPTSTTV